MTDNVNKPAHYTYGKIECKDAIRDVLGVEGFHAYCRGNVLKYLWRAGKKEDAYDDIEKASNYMDWLLEIESEEHKEVLRELIQEGKDRARCKEILKEQQDLPF